MIKIVDKKVFNFTLGHVEFFLSNLLSARLLLSPKGAWKMLRATGHAPLPNVVRPCCREAAALRGARHAKRGGAARLRSSRAARETNAPMVKSFQTTLSNCCPLVYLASLKSNRKDAHRMCARLEQDALLTQLQCTCKVP